jgi:Zn-dependent protease with chaperone function
MPAGAAGRPRLNPFAFVSDTSLRFVLLIVVVTCAAIERWQGIAIVWFGLGSSLTTCVGGGPVLSTQMFTRERAPVWFGCFHAVVERTLPGVAIGIGVLAAATAAIYAIFPAWQIRRRGLERLDPEDSRPFQQALDGLCQTAGLRRKPEFWWNPVDGRRSALAFGTRRRPRVALTGGLAVQCFADPAAFRAILLHELAHIRNGDIPITYLSISIVLAFLTTALPVCVAVSLNHFGTMYDVLFLIAELCLLAACVLLPLKAVLRARELYADARSLEWHDGSAALAKVFARLKPVSRFHRLLASHPEPARRCRLIEDTDEMFRFGTWDALGIGVGAGFAAFIVAGLSGSIFVLAGGPLLGPGHSTWIGTMAPAAAALAIVPLTAGAIAIGAWRAAFLRLMRGTGGASKMRIGIACGTGVVAGGLLLATIAFLSASAGISSGSGMVKPIGMGLPEAAGLALLLGFAFIVILAVAVMMLLSWVEAVGTAWLAVSLPRLTPGAPFYIGIGLCLLVATASSVGFPIAIGGSTFAMHDLNISGALAVFWVLGIAANASPFAFVTWPGVVGCWLLPLSSALFARTSGDCESWAFEPGATGPLPALPLFPGRAATCGAVCGIVTVISTTWLAVPLSPDALGGSGLPATQAAIGVLSRMLTSVAAVALIATAVAFTTPRLPIVHALCAGFFASIVIAAGEIIRMRLAGWATPVSGLVDIILPHLVFGGALAALLAATVAKCLKAVFGLLALRQQPRREYTSRA